MREAWKDVDAFLAASQALVAVAAASLAGLDDITLPQYRALVVLHRRGGATVGALADELGVHPSTATRRCDRLVRKGLVARDRPEGDRRTTEVTLAAPGHRIVTTVADRRRRAIAAAFEAMSPEDRHAAVAALEAFAAVAGDGAPADDWGWALGGAGAR